MRRSRSFGILQTHQDVAPRSPFGEGAAGAFKSGPIALVERVRRSRAGDRGVGSWDLGAKAPRTFFLTRKLDAEQWTQLSVTAVEPGLTFASGAPEGVARVTQATPG